MVAKQNKALEIYKYLKRKIDEGSFGLDDLLPTDYQLAEKFNVCRPTAAGAVKRLRSEGYVDRRAGYGTYVTKSVTRKPLAKELTLGLIIPGLGETEIFDPICGQIANLADQYNFHLLWGGGGGSFGKDGHDSIRQAERYISNGVDGVFFAPLELSPELTMQNNETLKILNAADIPVVLLDRDVVQPPGRSKYDLVGLNNIEAGFVIASHLMEQGCRNIGFLTRPNIAGTVYWRLMGAREAVSRAGLPCECIKVLDFAEPVRQFAAAQDFNVLDGLICYNDAIAATLLVELDRQGINIPVDLKICAFDDVKYATLLKVPLTTYHQPCLDIAGAAVETMLSRIRYPESAAREVLLRGELVLRESSSL